MQATHLCLLLACIACTPRGQDQPTRLPLPDDLGSIRTDDHYGLYLANQKVGWMRMTTGLEERGDEELFVSSLTGEMRMIVLGIEASMKMSEEKLFDRQAPYGFVSGKTETKDEDESEVTLLRREGDTLHVEILAGDTRRNREIPVPDYTFADVMTLHGWFRQERSVDDQIWIRTFDLSTLAPDIEQYRIVSKRTSLIDGVPMEYYESSVASEKGGRMGTFRIDGRGNMLSGALTGIFELRLEPEDVAKNLDVTLDLFVEGMVSIDRPIGDPSEIEELVVAVVGTDPIEIPSTPWQEVQRNVDTGEVTLSIGKAFGAPLRATEDEIAKHLEETVEYPIHYEDIQLMVADAIGDADSTREKVARLVAFVDEYIEDSYSAEPLTVLHVVDRKVGDCSEHAALFTTMARAAGIPCREISGLIYMGDESKAFGGHAWNQVVIDGHWVPVDPTWGETEINATHIALSIGTDDIAGMGFLFSDLEFRLVSVR